MWRPELQSVATPTARRTSSLDVRYCRPMRPGAWWVDTDLSFPGETGLAVTAPCGGRASISGDRLITGRDRVRSSR